MSILDLKTAAGVIADGGVVAYPTESCYGLGCDPRANQAVSRILQMKRRSWDKGLILIGADEKQLSAYINPSDDMMSAPRASWPGAYTWLLPARASVSRWIKGKHNTIAVRVPDHLIARDLCRYANRAIVSTSANEQGKPPARSAEEVKRIFGDAIDFVLEGALGGRVQPSEIRDAVSGETIRVG